MKKPFILIISFVLIICVIVLSKYYEFKSQKEIIDKFNLSYEKFLDKEILGTDITTVINKAVDDNENQVVKKDEKGKYIQDDEKSVYIEVKITEAKDKPIYNMESLYSGGMAEFAHYYGQEKFISTKVEYNSLGKVKYILFEQVLN